VILQVYADESGTHDPTGSQPSSQVAVVGGYMALLDDWEKFCSAWKAILKRHKAACFHANEFERRKGPYLLWSDHKADRFKYALSPIQFV